MAEDTLHPHVPAERAHLFHAYTSQATELEYLELLRSLVLALKPSCLLETGTHFGVGSLALAVGCEANGMGHVWTLDRDKEAIAQVQAKIADPENAPRRELRRITAVHCESAARWLAGRGPCGDGTVFDFAFLDSDLDERVAELEIAWRVGALAPGAVVVIHDTARTRTLRAGGKDPRTERFWTNFDGFARAVGVREVFEFALSRGLLVCRMPAAPFVRKA